MFDFYKKSEPVIKDRKDLEIDSLKQTIRGLGIDKDILRKEVRKRDNAIQDMQRACSDSLGECSKRDEEIDILDKTIRDQQRLIESLKNDIRKNDDEFGALNCDISELRIDLNNYKDRAEEAEHKLKTFSMWMPTGAYQAGYDYEKQQEIDKLKKELETMRTTLHASEKCNNERRTWIEKLQKELEESKREHELTVIGNKMQNETCAKAVKLAVDRLNANRNLADSIRKLEEEKAALQRELDELKKPQPWDDWPGYTIGLLFDPTTPPLDTLRECIYRDKKYVKLYNAVKLTRENSFDVMIFLMNSGFKGVALFYVGDKCHIEFTAHGVRRKLEEGKVFVCLKESPFDCLFITEQEFHKSYILK